MRRFIGLFAIITLAASVVAVGKDFWEKPYSKWSRKDVLKMLNDSPWAGEFTRTRNLGGKGSGIGGEKELFDKVTVRFFSSLPVRHAYFRMLQLLNNYEEMNDEGRRVFDQKFSGILRMDVSKQIIVAFELASNDRELGLRLDQYLRTTKTDLLKQSAYLISDRLERVQIEQYYPPSPDGTGAKLIFPREVDGQPVVSTEDKEVKIELYLPEIGRVFVTKKVKDMLYEDKLEL